MMIKPEERELFLFGDGTQYQAYRTFGAQVSEEGVCFTVYAPHARAVRVIGSFNGWDGRDHRMHPQGETGVWSLFVPECREGDCYKYEIDTPQGGMIRKADPFGFEAQVRPETASVVCRLDGYDWEDARWEEEKRQKDWLKEPMNIYELHAGSWRHHEDGTPYTWGEMAEELPGYVREMGYTHVEFMPVMEHPYDGSWGYQITGYYAPTSRYGSPREFMALVDRLHEKNIGVILDWVPGHFCRDDHGLRLFDGTPVFEYAEETRADKPQWGTLGFDLGKNQVHSFLISNALFWMEMYHVDGIRVDAVASMLYLDFGREGGGWIPNQYGGRENLEAVSFLKKMNAVIFARHPHALMMAEESTSWPLVSAPVYLGGLGFNFKWNMGWMNDMLRYMETEPVHRKWHHNLLTFSFFYAFSENFVLPLSHDEVVHGKKSLIDKMPGDYWQKFAGIRAFLGYMMTHPGKKLLFMGGEFGQFIEWDEKRSLDWFLLDYPMHAKLRRYVRELNRFYLDHPGLWELDHQAEGFSWIDANDYAQSVVTFMRLDSKGRPVVVVCNFTPQAHEDYRIGVPLMGSWEEAFNSDQEAYGGSGVVNRRLGLVSDTPWHNQPFSLRLRVPPLGMVVVRPRRRKGRSS